MASSLNIDPDRGASPTDIAVRRASYAQRAFPRSQELLLSPILRPVPRSVTLTWHDMGLSPYPGAFAVVADDQPDMLALLGTVIRVLVSSRSVIVHVIASALIDGDISLARRPYLALAPLNVDPLLASVEVLGER